MPLNYSDTKNLIIERFRQYGDNYSKTSLARELGVDKEQAQMLWERFKHFTTEEVAPTPESAVVTEKKIQVKKTSKRKTRKRTRPTTMAVKGIEATLEKVHEPPTWIIRVLALIVAVVFIVRPIGFALDLFMRTNNVFTSWAMSLAIAGAAFVSPQIMILGFKNKSVMTMFAGFLAAFGGFYFSIMVTVTELDYLYNKSQSTFVEATAVSSTVEADRASYKAVIDRETVNQQDAQKKVDALSPQIQYVMYGTKEYWGVMDAINKAEKPRNEARDLVREAQAKMNLLPPAPKIEAAKADNQYTIDLNRAKDMAFAVGMDILGPLLLSMALFLRKRPGKKFWLWDGWFKKKGAGFTESQEGVAHGTR